MSFSRSRHHYTRLSSVAVAAALLLCAAAGVQGVDNRNLAPGFTSLPRAAKVLVMPTDIELFEVSVGGVSAPKADWTETAAGHFKAALLTKKKTLGVAAVELSEKDADEAAEINALHGAVARSIQLHHFGPSGLHLPTKEGKLDWSLGEPVRMLKEKSGANYALFSWIRDTYASTERIAASILLAVVGVAMVPGGTQLGYASLVELDTGRIVWFNQLMRITGDLREADKARETLDALLDHFPESK